MPSDTGAPWLLPYPEDTDLVRDGADDIEALAVATAAGLSLAAGLVEVKSAIFTGTQTNSTATGGAFTITGLSITHAVADAANKLIISAFIGSLAESSGRGDVGLAIHDGTGFIAIGDADGNRTRVSSGGTTDEAGGTTVVRSPAVTFVHTPGAGSKTYELRAINVNESTRTLFVNRSELDNNSRGRPRSVSSLVIQEVRV